MIDFKKSKRITLFVGHYGSGKTNVAINYVKQLRKEFDNCAIADLDIVNPYFRTKDSETELKDLGIRLICSDYAGSNVDIPALPQDIYAITDDRRIRAVLDIGGDDRGALALGRIAPMIKEENDYEMVMVVNKFRPLTKDVQSTLEVMQEIEWACKIPFTAIVNNSNLGNETTVQDVIDSQKYAEDIAKATNLPVMFTSVVSSLTKDKSIEGIKGDIFSLDLQKKIV